MLKVSMLMISDFIKCQNLTFDLLGPITDQTSDYPHYKIHHDCNQKMYDLKMILCHFYNFKKNNLNKILTNMFYRKIKINKFYYKTRMNKFTSN